MTIPLPEPLEPQGLYIHIPFCEKKCHYCDFLSRPGNTDQMRDYLDLLASQAAWYQGRVRVESVFVGGGTPSALPIALLQEFLNKTLAPFDIPVEVEKTFECNPESFTPEKADALLAAGVNRLSFGFQSTDPGELLQLGRIHGRDRAFEAYADARRAGFANINVDLIYGYPGNDRTRWSRSLGEVVALAPEHLSTYCYILEEETYFHKEHVAGRFEEAEEELQLELFEMTIDELGKAGYEHYEISNFALPGRECRHNLRYWRQQEYLGVGIGAVSFFGGRRRSMARTVKEFGDQIREEKPWAWEEEPLSRIDRLKETVMLGLRTMEGVDLDTCRDAPLDDAELAQLTGILDPWVTKGLLSREGKRYRLTRGGIFLSNEVFTELV